MMLLLVRTYYDDEGRDDGEGVDGDHGDDDDDCDV